MASTSATLRAAQLKHHSALLLLHAAVHDRAEPRLRALALLDVATSRYSLWGAVAGVRANRARVFGAIIGLRTTVAAKQSTFRRSAPEAPAEEVPAASADSGKPVGTSSLLAAANTSLLAAAGGRGGGGATPVRVDDIPVGDGGSGSSGGADFGSAGTVQRSAAQLLLATTYERLVFGALHVTQNPWWTREKLLAPGQIAYSANPLLNPLLLHERWAM